MVETWQCKIMEVLKNYKEQISEDIYVNRININTTPNKAIEVLCKLFEKIESNIMDEHKKSFVTDTYENGIMNFATELMKVISKYHTTFLECAGYKRLLYQRHVAYAIYNLLNSSENKEFYNEITSSDELYKSTYMGLVEFYQSYYGSFYDNEKAIVLLCGFYPKDLVLDEVSEDKLVAALYKHITNAGTPTDIGYAFGGIEKIKKHIGGLPEHIVEKLLKRYELFYILNEKVRRHQIFEIINCSKINIEDKPKIKFFFLDSLIISDQLNRVLFRRKEELSEIFDGEVKPHYNSSDQNIQREELILFDVPKSYWTNEVSQIRQFYVNRTSLIKIELKNDDIIINNKKNKQLVKQKFNYDDWIMDTYHSRKFENDIDELILKSEKERESVQMTFSLVQLEKYRGIDSRTIDFDHRFKIDEEYKITKNKKESNQRGMQFYGKNIHTMTCIVGKNGTGKTSIIDFLRETFFKMIMLIEEFNIVVDAGYINEKDYIDYEILEKDAKFLVIFRIGENDFYITNNSKIDGLDNIQVLPYKKGTYVSNNELSKIIYFSNMLSLNQNLSIENEEQVRNLDKEKEDKKKKAKALNDFKQIVCSEKKSYLEKMRSIKAYRERINKNESQISENLNNRLINKELYIQLTYLESITRETLKNDIDISDKNKFCINSELLKNRKQFNCIEDLNKAFLVGALDELLYVPDSRIDYFSSGQYAKFSFLSKLYWIMEGYQKKRKDLEQKSLKTQFTDDEALLKEDSALIFIDEGELYYHPEWQRRYIKTLVDLIQGHAGRIQIIITTNSPFILSDIRTEDVCYLSDSATIKDETFGQNIHKLLKDNFFMDFTIGEYSRIIVEKIISWLGEDDKNKEKNIEETILVELHEFYGEEIHCEDIYKMIDQLIDQIGENVYRVTLRRMLEESQFMNKQKRIDKLKEEKERIEIEIEKLRSNTND